MANLNFPAIYQYPNIPMFIKMVRNVTNEPISSTVHNGPESVTLATAPAIDLFM